MIRDNDEGGKTPPVTKKSLTLQMVQMRCKTDQIATIDKINLWGNDLEDVSLLKEMPNLRVVSLSVNKLASLEVFAYCPKLKELYLRKNQIRDLNEISFLQNLPFLDTLWLDENPCAMHPKYRATVDSMLPNLVKLDDIEVSMEEKEGRGSPEQNYSPPPQDFSQAQSIPSTGGHAEISSYNVPSQHPTDLGFQRQNSALEPAHQPVMEEPKMKRQYTGWEKPQDPRPTTAGF